MAAANTSYEVVRVQPEAYCVELAQLPHIDIQAQWTDELCDVTSVLPIRRHTVELQRFVYSMHQPMTPAEVRWVRSQLPDGWSVEVRHRKVVPKVSRRGPLSCRPSRKRYTREATWLCVIAAYANGVGLFDGRLYTKDENYGIALIAWKDGVK